MLNILLIEDSGVFREVEVALLNKIKNSNLTIAVNFNNSLEILSRQSFDLIICDYHLPDGNGLDILNFVREKNKKDKKNLNVPFIMVTGNNDVGIVKQCIEKGVTDYLVKPLQASTFLQKCSQALCIAMPKY